MAAMHHEWNGTAHDPGRGPLQALADPLDLRSPWSFVLYAIASGYVFFGIHLICHKYLSASIELVVTLSGMSDDMAGATLMACATSMPELLSGIIGVFVPGAMNTGLGTVVGSLVFNLLVITGGCLVVFPGGVMTVSSSSTVRDVTFQLLVIAAMAWAFWDHHISKLKAGVFIGLYIVYVLVCWKAKVVARYLSARCGDTVSEVEVGGQQLATLTPSDNLELTSLQPQLHLEGRYISLDTAAQSDNENNLCEDGSKGKGRYRHNVLRGIVVWVLGMPLLPLRSLCAVTIPNCTSPFWIRHIWIGLVLSLFSTILWIALLVFLMLEWAMKAGRLIGVSSTVMGLTFCAAGTSVPDCMCSLIVAQKGKGDMAISNVFGSNVFDILVAMGVPWALELAISQKAIVVRNEGFMSSVVILLLVLIFYVACVSLMRCKLPRWVGYMHLSLYVVYLAYVVVADSLN